MLEARNPYSPIEAEVVDSIVETPMIKTLELRPSQPIPFAAGQFVELTLPGVGEAPFTPSSRPWIDDRLFLTIMNVGKVTDAAHRLRKGDTVGLRGPLGVGYPLDSFEGREILVVGGGCGFAPLRSLMYCLLERAGDFGRLYFRGGCKSFDDLLYRKEFEEWSARQDLDIELTLDEGDASWTGHVGVVTAIMDNVDMDCRRGVAILCGPPVMMKHATDKLLEMGFSDENIYISMERNMSCGIGKCGHCRLGLYYVCTDGPVFSYQQIKGIPDVWH